MSASSMIQLARKLLSESEDVSADKRARTLAALIEAKAVLELRNKILHATVGGSFVKGKTAFYNSRRKTVPGVAGRLPQLEAALHGPEDLDEIGARLYKAQEELWDCVY
jgi:hypothetical protein